MSSIFDKWAKAAVWQILKDRDSAAEAARKTALEARERFHKALLHANCPDHAWVEMPNADRGLSLSERFKCARCGAIVQPPVGMKLE